MFSRPEFFRDVLFDGPEIEAERTSSTESGTLSVASVFLNSCQALLCSCCGRCETMATLSLAASLQCLGEVPSNKHGCGQPQSCRRKLFSRTISTSMIVGGRVTATRCSRVSLACNLQDNAGSPGPHLALQQSNLHCTRYANGHGKYSAYSPLAIPTFWRQKDML